MRKEIKKYGNSAVIVLDSEDLKVYDLAIGDYVDISEIMKIKKLPKDKSKIKKEIKLSGAKQ